MAARPRNLKVVKDGAPAKSPRRGPKSITQAAAGGDQKELLVALRERVATAVEDPNCPPRDLAALSRRLQEITRDIEAIVAREKQEAAEDANGKPADEEWDSEAL